MAAANPIPMGALVEEGGTDSGSGAEAEGDDEEMEAAAVELDEEGGQDGDEDDEEEEEGEEEEEEEDDKELAAVPVRRSSRTGNIKAVKAATANLRRSSREAKPRLVYVGDVPVLKSNLYDLETGEPSVFDKELAKGGL
jgi:hypothetical protein